MIPVSLIDYLKSLAKNAPAGPLAIVQMDSKGTAFQLQTTRANGGVVIATCRNRHNAEYMAWAWEWLPKLVEELERRETVAAIQAARPFLDSGTEVPTMIAPAPRERQRRKRVRSEG